MTTAIAHAGLILIGFLVILEGLGLAVYPKIFGFLAGPGASRKDARGWTRYQGLGLMLLGGAFVMAAGHGDVAPVVVLSMVASLMFSLAVLGRSRAKA